jgi:hypothetical protein
LSETALHTLETSVILTRWINPLIAFNGLGQQSKLFAVIPRKPNQVLTVGAIHPKPITKGGDNLSMQGDHLTPRAVKRFAP